MQIGRLLSFKCGMEENYGYAAVSFSVLWESFVRLGKAVVARAVNRTQKSETWSGDEGQRFCGR